MVDPGTTSNDGAIVATDGVAPAVTSRSAATGRPGPPPRTRKATRATTATVPRVRSPMIGRLPLRRSSGTTEATTGVELTVVSAGHIGAAAASGRSALVLGFVAPDRRARAVFDGVGSTTSAAAAPTSAAPTQRGRAGAASGRLKGRHDRQPPATWFQQLAQHELPQPGQVWKAVSPAEPRRSESRPHRSQKASWSSKGVWSPHLPSGPGHGPSRGLHDRHVDSDGDPARGTGALGRWSCSVRLRVRPLSVDAGRRPPVRSRPDVPDASRSPRARSSPVVSRDPDDPPTGVDPRGPANSGRSTPS